MPGDFTDLICWQQAIELVGDSVRVARHIHGINAMKLRQQLVEAAESVPANIAEGYGRGKGLDCARFLRIAIASAAEVENHLRSAVVSDRLDGDAAAPVIARARRTRALTTGFMRSQSQSGDGA